MSQGPEREAILPHLADGNRAKTEAAPVTAVIGFVLAFFEILPRLFPHFDGARAVFADAPALDDQTAIRKGSLQGGQLILALRAVGFTAARCRALIVRPCRKPSLGRDQSRRIS